MTKKLTGCDVFYEIPSRYGLYARTFCRIAVEQGMYDKVMIGVNSGIELFVFLKQHGLLLA